jgi:hypothetical protein
MIPAIIFAAVATGTALLAAEKARTSGGKARKIAVREGRKVAKARTARVKHVKTMERERVKSKRARRKRKRRPTTKGTEPAPMPGIPAHKVKLKSTTTRKAYLPKPAPSLRIRPKKYAEQLYVYASRMIRAGKASKLGTKANPNPEVKRMQGGMRRLTKDGIYGPATRKRGKELIGKSFPIRRSVKPAEREPFKAPAPLPAVTAPPPIEREPEYEAPPEPEPAPLARAPKRAALDLLSYARSIGKSGRAAAFGYKNNPNETVEDAQRDMGGLVADGIYGPNTRRRGRTLTGQSFPAR